MHIKKLFWIISVAILMLTACSSNDDDENKAENLTAEQLVGLWVTEYAESGTDGDLHWTRALEDYRFNADGTGYYESYLMDGRSTSVPCWCATKARCTTPSRATPSTSPTTRPRGNGR